MQSLLEPRVTGHNISIINNIILKLRVEPSGKK